MMVILMMQFLEDMQIKILEFLKDEIIKQNLCKETQLNLKQNEKVINKVFKIKIQIKWKITYNVSFFTKKLIFFKEIC